MGNKEAGEKAGAETGPAVPKELEAMLGSFKV
jgi:hypothetical protein